MNDTPTPRVDAQADHAGNFHNLASVVDANLARDLERQLAEATAWRPIASVPLKSDALLYWPPKRGRTLRPAQQTVGQVNSLCHYDGATHWQPLPNPPSEKP